MTTSCQDIINRAKAANTLNTVLVADRVTMLSRILADQAALFTKIADTSRGFLLQTDSLTSSSASSNRTVDLSPAGNLTRALERLERVVFANNGAEIFQVDPNDPDAEYAPRYTLQGFTLTEVGNDWGLSTIAIPLTITYTWGPTLIVPTGTLSQVVSVPDQWADTLVFRLASYLAQSDPGRPDTEIARLDALATGADTKFLAYVRHVGGVEVRRFDQPTPAESGKK